MYWKQVGKTQADKHFLSISNLCLIFFKLYLAQRFFTKKLKLLMEFFNSDHAALLLENPKIDRVEDKAANLFSYYSKYFILTSHNMLFLNRRILQN